MSVKGRERRNAMKVYSHTVEDMTRDANAVKEAVVFALERDGLLNGRAEDVLSKYVVVLHEKGWLGRLFRRFNGEEDKGEGLAVTVTKVV